MAVMLLKTWDAMSAGIPSKIASGEASI